jgi:hypothetical protein
MARRSKSAARRRSTSRRFGGTRTFPDKRLDNAGQTPDHSPTKHPPHKDADREKHMMTVKHMERLWRANRPAKLLADVTEGRGGTGWAGRLAELNFAGGNHNLAPLTPLAAAAAALLRLDDLGQGHAAFAKTLRSRLRQGQRPDGTWGDLGLTALCVRVLTTPADAGAASRGLAALAEMQRDDGSWSATGVRRVIGDVDTTLAIAEHLTFIPRLDGRPSLEAALSFLATAKLTPEQRRTFARVESRRRFVLTPVESWS